jgi:hypothetical protein
MQPALVHSRVVWTAERSVIFGDVSNGEVAFRKI